MNRQRSVAADMNAYSETQVTNFLKRASFNRKIHNSAKTYAGVELEQAEAFFLRKVAAVATTSSSSSGGIVEENLRIRYCRYYRWASQFSWALLLQLPSFASMPSSSSTSFHHSTTHQTQSSNGDNKPKLEVLQPWNSGLKTRVIPLMALILKTVSGSDNKRVEV